MHWDKIPPDYVLTYKLITTYKLKVKDEQCSRSKWDISNKLKEYIYNAELISLLYPVYPMTENYGESGELICIN